MERTPRENLTRGELTLEHEGKWQQVLHIHYLYLSYREFIAFFSFLFLAILLLFSCLPLSFLFLVVLHLLLLVFLPFPFLAFLLLLFLSSFLSSSLYFSYSFSCLPLFPLPCISPTPSLVFFSYLFHAILLLLFLLSSPSSSLHLFYSFSCLPLFHLSCISPPPFLGLPLFSLSLFSPYFFSSALSYFSCLLLLPLPLIFPSPFLVFLSHLCLFPPHPPLLAFLTFFQSFSFQPIQTFLFSFTCPYTLSTNFLLFSGAALLYSLLLHIFFFLYSPHT